MNHLCMDVKHIIELYKESKRFIAYTENGIDVLHDEDNLEKITKEHKKIIFNVECSIALLDEKLRNLFLNDIANTDNYWYIGVMSRSTYYRHREKAGEIFLKNYRRLETL